MRDKCHDRHEYNNYVTGETFIIECMRPLAHEGKHIWFAGGTTIEWTHGKHED